MSKSLDTSKIVLDAEGLPSDCATSWLMTPPSVTNLNYAGSGRASTPIYGTAPYMGGKGAPGELIMVDDMLRPQSTSFFKKGYQGRPYDTLSDMSCSVPLRTMDSNPASSRANIQNQMFGKRYR